VGAGTLANALPGYPADPNSLNLASDFVYEFRSCIGLRAHGILSGHNITEVAWDGVKIAGQKTHDFFGDGSLFLLDMPGVSVSPHFQMISSLTVITDSTSRATSLRSHG
jgi:hypothetical protein